MEDAKRQQMLEKIQALLNKAESTDFPDEAAAFMAKAQELLTKHSLDEAELQALGKKHVDDHVITIRIRVDDPHCQARGLVLSAVARANDCKVVRSDRTRNQYVKEADDLKFIRPNSKKTMTWGMTFHITGFSRDVDAVVMTFTSLLIQLTREFAATKVPSHLNRMTFYREFVIGYSDSIRARLMEAKRQATKAATDSVKAQGGDLLPVLASRKAQVDAAFEQRWAGGLAAGRAGRVNYGSGWAAGQAAGQRADVGGPRVGGRGPAALGR